MNEPGFRQDFIHCTHNLLIFEGSIPNMEYLSNPNIIPMPRNQTMLSVSEFLQLLPGVIRNLMFLQPNS